MPNDLLEIREICRVLGVSRGMLFDLRKDPRFPRPYKAYPMKFSLSEVVLARRLLRKSAVNESGKAPEVTLPHAHLQLVSAPFPSTAALPLRQPRLGGYLRKVAPRWMQALVHPQAWHRRGQR